MMTTVVVENRISASVGRGVGPAVGAISRHSGGRILRKKVFAKAVGTDYLVIGGSGASGNLVNGLGAKPARKVKQCKHAVKLCASDHQVLSVHVYNRILKSSGAPDPIAGLYHS